MVNFDILESKLSPTCTIFIRFFKEVYNSQAKLFGPEPRFFILCMLDEFNFWSEALSGPVDLNDEK